MICGQVLWYRHKPAGICTHPWGIEHSHDDMTPLVRIYNGETEPEDVTVHDALDMLRDGVIYQHDDGTFWTYLKGEGE